MNTISKKRISILATGLVVGAVMFLGLSQLQAERHLEDIMESWTVTPYSTTSQSNCPENQLCVEWCMLFQGGVTAGSGNLCCIEADSIGSTNPNVCSSFRDD